MKTFLVIIGTAIITWATLSVVHSVRTGVERLWLVSAVKTPGSKVIREIQDDMNAGRYQSAKAKIDAFADAWQRFNSGPDSCSGRGIGDIMVTFSELDKALPASPESKGPAAGSQPSTWVTNRGSGTAAPDR